MTLSTAEAVTARPDSCKPAARAIRYYSALTHAWQARHKTERAGRLRWPTCFMARRAAAEWQARAENARDTYERWVVEHTLDPELVTWRLDERVWERAVEEVQKVFPGTAMILLSCSDSEGGRGRWVRHGGGAYYAGYRGVGGWLQFLPGTFDRHFAAALGYARARGFRVPAAAASWFSPLGQALAGAWGLTYSRREWAGAGCHP